MAGSDRSAVDDPPAPIVRVGEAREAVPRASSPRPRRRSKRAVLALGVVIATIAGAAGATFTPIFRARHIVVLGLERVREDEVLEASGLSDRTNVIHLEAEAAISGIGELPWVLGARIDRELPDTIIVTIRERAPVAVIVQAGSERLVTRDGAALEGSSGARLPTIGALTGAPDPDAIAGAAEAVAAMTPSLARRVGEVILVPGGTILLRLRSGTPVEWGSATEPSEKAAALSAILSWIESSGTRVSSIDVSVPQAPRATTGITPSGGR